MNPLARHYTRFRVHERLLLTGHSHQAWPDVAFEGLTEAFEDAAEHVDDKWTRAFAKAEVVRDGYRRLLDEPTAEIALAANTHELVVRFLSALDLRRRPRLLTTNGEFHTLRRQLGRLGDLGLDVITVPAQPVETLAARLAERVDHSTAAVLVSAVLFEDASIVPHLGDLASACRERGSEILIDAYHALGAIPFRTADQGLDTAWITGGGYKYLQLGEGNAFLRIPQHAHDARPVYTGWYAEFAQLEESRRGAVAYPHGAAAFAGSTYDPSSHYRAARVVDFFREQELTPERLRASYLHQLEVLTTHFDALGADDDVVTRERDRPLEAFAGFLALRSPHAARLRAGLARRGVQVDQRGDYLRFGPAPYLDDAQLEESIAVLGEVVRTL